MLVSFAKWLFTIAITSVFGVTNVIGGIIVAAFAAVLWAFGWHRRRVQNGKPGVQTWHWLVGGIAITWIGVTVLFASAVIMVWRGEAVPSSPLVTAPSAPADDGKPLKWFSNISMEGGPIMGRNVFSITFSGWNSSEKEVLLKSAAIRSALNGTELPLKVIAENPETKKNDIVSLGSINLVPAGAPIKLVAQFNLPTGLIAQDFLATWSRFNLVVTDDTAEYRVPFNEAIIQVFFPGMVGPHVTMKSDPPSGYAGGGYMRGGPQ